MLEIKEQNHNRNILSSRITLRIRGSLCERKSRNIITDIRTRANFSNATIDSSCFRSASSFAPAVLCKRTKVTSWCSAIHRPAGVFRTKSSFGSSRALFRRIEFRRTANIRRRAEYLGPYPPGFHSGSRRVSLTFSFPMSEYRCLLYSELTLPY